MYINFSGEFQGFVYEIGGCDSREKEEELVKGFAKFVNERVDSGKKLTKKKKEPIVIYEAMVSAIHFHLIGTESIHNITKELYHQARDLTQSEHGFLAAIGYLVFTLHGGNFIEIGNSLVNSLMSSDQIKRAIALNTLSHFMKEDFPIIYDLVIGCLESTDDIIRRKALICVASFMRNENLGFRVDTRLRTAAYDSILKMAHPLPYSYVSPLVTILESFLDMEVNISRIHKEYIESGRLFSYFDEIIDSVGGRIVVTQQLISHIHQDFPAPFIALNLMQFFKKFILKHGNTYRDPLVVRIIKLSNKILDSPKFTYSYATVLYECLRTLIDIDYYETNDFKRFISRFLVSNVVDIKFIGIEILAKVCKKSASIALLFSNEIMKIYDEIRDETVMSSIIDILFEVSSKNNFKIIIKNVINFIQEFPTNCYISQMISNAINVLSSFVQDDQLSQKEYLEIIFALFTYADDNITSDQVSKVCFNLDEDSDAVDYVIDLLIDHINQNLFIPDQFLIVCSYVLGEYGHSSAEYELSSTIVDYICDMASRNPNTRFYFLEALFKLLPHIEPVPKSIIDEFERFKNSTDIHVQEICYEFLFLSQNRSFIPEVFKEYDADAFTDFLQKYHDQVDDNQPDYVSYDERIIQTPSTVRKDEIKFENDPEPIPVVHEVIIHDDEAIPVIDGGWDKDKIDIVIPEPSVIHQKIEDSHQAVPKGHISILEKFTPVKDQNPTKDGIKNIFDNANTIKPVKKKTHAKKTFMKKPEYTEEEIQIVSNTLKELESCPEAISVLVDDKSFDDNNIEVFKGTRISIKAYVSGKHKILMSITNLTEDHCFECKLDMNFPVCFDQRVTPDSSDITCIPGNATIHRLFELSYNNKITDVTQFSFTGSLSYRGSNQLKFNIPLNICDFIDPSQGTENDFQHLYNSNKNNILKYKFKSNGRTLDQLSDTISNTLHFTKISRKKYEIIYIGSLFEDSVKVCLWLAFSPDDSNIKIFAPSQELTKLVLDVVSQNIK